MNSAASGLLIEQVHVWRGERHLLRGISASLAPGRLLHVSGPNGAGKSTLLRVLTGLLRPEQGNVSWQGRAIRANAVLYQAEVAFAAHEPALKADLTALENLHFSVGLKRAVSRPDLLDVLRQTGVAQCAELPARVLSAGQRRRVAMARVIALQAPLWLLDEPFSNLDASGCRVLSELLDAHIRAGGTAVVVAHQEVSLSRDVQRLELNA